MSESEKDKLARKQREVSRNSIATVNRQMSIKQLKEQIERERWPSNDRIDDIGRNHVDGEIYNRLDIYD